MLLKHQLCTVSICDVLASRFVLLDGSFLTAIMLRPYKSLGKRGRSERNELGDLGKLYFHVVGLLLSDDTAKDLIICHLTGHSGRISEPVSGEAMNDEQ